MNINFGDSGKCEIAIKPSYPVKNGPNPPNSTPFL